MTHPSDDVLAGLVVGDADVASSVADHAATCERCQEVIGELADVGLLLGEHSGTEFPRPSPAVWDAIAAATAPAPAGSAATEPVAGGPTATDSAAVARAVIEPAVPAPTSNVSRLGSRSPAPRPSGMPRWALAVAAAVLAVAGFGLGRLTSPVPTGTVVAQPTTAATTGTIRPTGALSVARLTSLDGSRVLGEADLGPSDGRLVLHVRAGAVTAPAGGYLEIWLINTDGRRMVSVGLLDPGHDATFVIPADLVAQGYRVVDISNELFDDKPAHSGDSIMRGSLPA